MKALLTALGRSLYVTARTLNLLEPNTRYPVVSISKTAMWGSMFMLGWMVASHADQVGSVITAMGANVATIINYAYRRHVQAQTGTGTYGGKDEIH